jgi:hypothetical protein
LTRCWQYRHKHWRRSAVQRADLKSRICTRPGIVANARQLFWSGNGRQHHPRSRVDMFSRNIAGRGRRLSDKRIPLQPLSDGPAAIIFGLWGPVRIVTEITAVRPCSRAGNRAQIDDSTFASKSRSSRLPAGPQSIRRTFCALAGYTSVILGTGTKITSMFLCVIHCMACTRLRAVCA